jgi:phage gp46-like protein
MAQIIITPLVAIERPALPWDTRWQGLEGIGDWALAGADLENPMGLKATASIETAIILSLFTDRRAPENWRPDTQDRRGWWGDAMEPAGLQLDPMGSWLWLLENEVVSARNVALAKAYAEAALEWLTRDGVAARVEVIAEARADNHGINLGVAVYASSGERTYSRMFDFLWRQIA